MKNTLLLCVQGDVNDTYKYLKGLENKSDEQAKMVGQYYNRFFKENPDYQTSHEDLWIENILNAYRSYFVDVLTNKENRSNAEDILVGKLNGQLSVDVQGTDMKSTEESIESIFQEKGFNFLGGKIAPHYGPFIWKKTQSKTYHVEIPDTTEQVQVNFLDDFLMFSWLHFATFGEVSAGGWAEKDALYCILPKYREKLNTDIFQVSFLKHEAQHFSDYRNFPELKALDLEYRAKLVELIYYADYGFFEKLLIQAVKNKDSPHNYSSFIIMEQFSERFFNKAEEKQLEKWHTINYEDIRKHAKALFDEHTVLLKTKGAANVEGVI